MSGSKKNKNKTVATPDQPALPGPTYPAIPAPQPMPGQLELLAQQINQGYPSMGSADLLKHLQSVYKPPAPGPAPAMAAAVLPAASTGMASQGAGAGSSRLSGGMINSMSDFLALMEQAKRQQGG